MAATRMLTLSRWLWLLCSIACIAGSSGVGAAGNRGNDVPELSFERTAASPVIPRGQTGLMFNLRPDDADHPSTIVLYCAYALGDPYHYLYGGQLLDAIHIVAIRQATGEVFIGAPIPPDTFPINMPAADEPKRSPKEAPLLSVGGVFNVDLRRHLSLPQTAGDYAVFLWIDDLVTPVQIAHLPGPAQDAALLTMPPRRIAFTKAAAGDGPAADRDAIRLGFDSDRVTVALPEMLGRAGSPAADAAPLTILALAHRRRIVAWQSAPLAAALHDVPGGRFSFHLYELIGRPEQPEKLFVLAVVGDRLSKVLVIPRER